MKFKNVTVDWPLASNTIRRKLEAHTFGMVRQKADGSVKPHQGWDLYAPVGTPCYAISKGRVAYVGQRGALGLLVVVSIGDTGYYAAYAHLSKSMVKVGDEVKIGQQVALTGNSGNVYNMAGDDEHLHFEIRTAVLTGLGLTGRVSPLAVFGEYPLTKTYQKEFV